MGNADMAAAMAVEGKANGLLQELNSLQGTWVNLDEDCDYHSSSQNQNTLPVWKEDVRGSLGIFNDRWEPASSRFVYPCVYKAVPMASVQYLTGINAYIASLNRISGLLITKEKNNDRAGACVPSLGGCHSEFSERLERLIDPSFAYQSLDALYGDISESIYKYDHCLDKVPGDLSDLFLEYSAILDGVLLVVRKRQINILDVADIFLEMNRLYYIIYSDLASKDCTSVPAIKIKIGALKERVNKKGLMPTVEECEEDMEETIASMTEEEKEDLARLLGH